jgi:hypothetical protein
MWPIKVEPCTHIPSARNFLSQGTVAVPVKTHIFNEKLVAVAVKITAFEM